MKTYLLALVLLVTLACNGAMPGVPGDMSVKDMSIHDMKPSVDLTTPPDLYSPVYHFGHGDFRTECFPRDPDEWIPSLFIGTIMKCPKEQLVVYKCNAWATVGPNSWRKALIRTYMTVGAIKSEKPYVFQEINVLVQYDDGTIDRFRVDATAPAEDEIPTFNIPVYGRRIIRTGVETSHICYSADKTVYMHWDTYVSGMWVMEYK